MSEPLEHPAASGEPDIDAATAAAKAVLHTRRAFIFKLSVMLNAAVGAVLAVPLVGYLLGPALKKGSNTGSWIGYWGGIDDFPAGETRLAEFRSPVANFDDGDTAKVACWVRRSRTTVSGVRDELRAPGMPSEMVRAVEAVLVSLPRRSILRRWKPGVGASGARAIRIAKTGWRIR